MISKPNQDWKDLLNETETTLLYEYHLNPMAWLNEFMRTMNNPEKGIGVTIPEKNKGRFEENREILMSVIKCLESCGRHGISWRGHTDDNTTSSFNNRNFKELL